MRTMPTFAWSSVLGLILALVWTTVPLVSSQALPSTTPAPVQEFAFARSGSKLLVSGGRQVVNQNQVALTGQLFALDLSTSWNVSSAPWTQLAASNPNYWYYMVAAPDNNTVYTLQSGVNNSMTVYTYSVLANQWSTSTMTMPPTTETREGVRPVLDPTSWLIYLDASIYLDVFNPNATGTTSFLTMPSNTFTSRLFSGAIYNKARHSLMYYGGLNFSLEFDPLATYVSEYTISTNTWSNLTTTGTPPPVRSDFCMAVSEDGNTVVVYGGRSPNSPVTPPSNFTDTFYVLDVPTGQWTEGPPGDLRAYMGCIIVGDQFIAWGGTDGINTLNTPPRVFDLTKMLWVTTYTAPSYYSSVKSPSASAGASPSSATVPLPGSSGGTTSKSSNTGAIVGGAVGGLAVIGLAAGVFVFLKRKERAQYSAPADQQGATNAASRNGAMGPNSAEKDFGAGAFAAAGATLANDLRNPQKSVFVSQNSNTRNPQDQSGLGSMAPLMGGGEGYTTLPAGYSPYDQNQNQYLQQQQYSGYPQPPVQYAVLPKEMQAVSAPMVQASTAPTSAYIPKTAYSAPAGVGMQPPTTAGFVPQQGYLTSTVPTGDVYRSQHIGSPAVSVFADSTVASSTYSGPPPTFTSQPVGISGYVPTSNYTSGNSNQTFSSTAANSSPVGSHASYNYNSNSSFAPSSAGHSGDVYAASSIAAASPSMSATAGHGPLPLNQSGFVENGVTSTVAVRVPDSVPEDQYLAYVLAQQQQQQHDPNLTSVATTTTVSEPLSSQAPQSLPPRPNMQTRQSSTSSGSAQVVQAAPGFEDAHTRTQDANYNNYVRPPPGSGGSNSSGYVRPPLGPPQ